MSEKIESGQSNGSMQITVDPELTGRHVEADGGTQVGNTNFASRAEFEGILTGRKIVQGDPPWYWLEIGQLSVKPDDFEDEFVWCEESYVYSLD
jgi:hypothetical protein|tara:strand:+ start:8593 stop:8874 length:282 start_codon:yes stop_codon:yes gene_type:complete